MTDHSQHRRMLVNRLRKNRRRLGATARRLGVTCYRVYDGDIPEVPLYVDDYEGRLHISVLRRRGFTAADDRGWAQAMVAGVEEALAGPETPIYVKTRERQKGPAQYEKFAAEGREVVVHEGGLKFVVNLTEYLDTGLFLDHRVTREMVRERAEDKKVLNLFAYTGSFSVYAAAGGASETTTVDLSNTYLGMAEVNLKLNGLAGRQHEIVRSDILRWLEQELPARRHRYDLVVFDPPTFSRSKKMVRDLDIQRDHPWMLKYVVEMTRPGGEIYFSTNFRDFLPRFDELQGLAVEEITSETIPFDFQYSQPHRCWRMRVASS